MGGQVSDSSHLRFGIRQVTSEVDGQGHRRYRINGQNIGCCVDRHGPTDESVLPILWQDNYFSLLPGESRQVTATYKTNDLGRSSPVVAVEGWNVKTIHVP